MKKTDDKHILITGGAGYIGSHVAKQLLQESSHKITILDNLSTGFLKTIETLQSIRTFTFVQEDLSKWEKIDTLLQNNDFDAVIHFAASIVVPESVENPLKYYMNNTANTTNLINCCIKHHINNFIFSSTAAVYGEPDIQKVQNGVNETFETCPINPYGQSKLFSEKILQDTQKAHKDFNYVIFRYFNVAGSDTQGMLGQNTKNATHLIKIATQTALGNRDHMAIFGDDYATPDGTCIRDYIHVQDLANAHIFGLDFLHTRHASEIFNVGYAQGFSVKEVVQTIKAVTQTDFRVNTENRRPGDPAFLIADNTKLLTTYAKMNSLKPLFQYNDINIICKTAYDWEKRINT
jgi:UDP-glucose 4-epimerase